MKKNPSLRPSKKPPVEDMEHLRKRMVAQFKVLFTEAKLEEQQDQLISLLSTRAASGDTQYFALLVRLAYETIQAIDNLTTSNFDAARKVARNYPFWPLLLSQSSHHVGEELERLKRLELGSDCDAPINIEKAYYYPKKTIPRQIAIGLLCFTRALRRFYPLWVVNMDMANATGDWASALEFLLKRNRLKERQEFDGAIAYLTKVASIIKVPNTIPDEKLLAFAEEAHHLPILKNQTCNTWKQFGRKVIAFLTGERPEDNEVLRELGKYREDSYYWKDTTNFREMTERKKTAKAKRTEYSNIRDGIFTRICNAYDAVFEDRGENATVQSKSSPQPPP